MEVVKCFRSEAEERRVVKSFIKKLFIFLSHEKGKFFFFFPCKALSKKVFLEREKDVNKASNLKRCW